MTLENRQLLGVEVDDRERSPMRDNSHLAGIPPGKAPVRPYRVSGEVAKEAGRIRELTGKLGQICETGVLEVWQGDRRLANEHLRQELGDCLGRINAELREVIGDKHRESHEIAWVYQELAKDTGIPWNKGDLVEPQNADFKRVLREIDAFYDVGFVDFYQQLASVSVGGEVTPRARYLIEASLVLGKEMIEPSFDSLGLGECFFCPDVQFNGMAQFDAVLVWDLSWVAEQSDFLSSSEAEAGGSKSRAVAFSPGQLLSSRTKWAILEIKTPFRTAHTTGGGLSRGPVRGHLKRTMGQLGQLAFNWSVRNNSQFPFPEFVQFVYLRGYLPHASHRVGLDAGFLKSWGARLDNDLRKLKLKELENKQKIREVESLKGILSPAAEERSALGKD